jgi:archaellum component FlaF (FlaF/FlaG flagellin family)
MYNGGLLIFNTEFRLRKGYSSVISSMILTSAVIIIGSILWAYSQSATVVMTNSYLDETFSTLNNLIERFTIEKIYYNDTDKKMILYIYNYGDISITLDIYINSSNGSAFSSSDNNVDRQCLQRIEIPVDVSSGSVLSIKCHTRRSNDVLAKYYVL